MAPRGYRMGDVDEVLDRLAAELADRDARIEELRVALAGAQAYALSHDPGARTPGDAGADAGPGTPPAGPPHHG